ncbi:MAG: hypothetical protein E5W82_23895 [Mesorhizobium sp.]|nr:MAG: hypothetical protein E5W82_23895 [Mesorhizobium sp.]
MPHLHMKGVDLVVDLLDAAEHVDKLSPEEVKDLLLEAASVLGELLMRDVPADIRQQDEPAYPPRGLTKN